MPPRPRSAGSSCGARPSATRANCWTCWDCRSSPRGSPTPLPRSSRCACRADSPPACSGAIRPTPCCARCCRSTTRSAWCRASGWMRSATARPRAALASSTNTKAAPCWSPPAAARCTAATASAGISPMARKPPPPTSGARPWTTWPRTRPSTRSCFRAATRCPWPPPSWPSSPGRWRPCPRSGACACTPACRWSCPNGWTPSCWPGSRPCPSRW